MHVFGVYVLKNNSSTWSLTESIKGARSIEEITEKAQLSKNSKVHLNCCQKSIFSFIPMERVIIDNIHLFLRISDVLINLLIRETFMLLMAL